MEFKDRVVVITGAATGIGFGYAKRLGLEGAKLIICGRRQQRVDEAVAALKALGFEAAGTRCDVANRDDVEELADFAWAKYGHVDALINNAGIAGVQKTTLELTAQEVKDHFAINVGGTINGVEVFSKRFIEQGTPCAIYNQGSENSLFDGHRGVPWGTDYVASKHVILSYTDSLRFEVPDFFRIGLICPGLVNSELGEDGIDVGMDTDKFADIVVQQMKAECFYIVSHAYNMVNIDERYNEIRHAYATYAPRYENDIEFDVRTLVPPMLSKAAERQG